MPGFPILDPITFPCGCAAAIAFEMPGIPIDSCRFGATAAAIAFEMPAAFPIALPCGCAAAIAFDTAFVTLVGLSFCPPRGAVIVELVSIMIRKRQTEVKECIDKSRDERGLIKSRVIR